MEWAAMEPTRKALLATGAVFVVLEVADAFRIEEPAFAVAFAAITAAALAWTWWGGVGGPVMVLVLALFELAGVLFIYGPPASPFEYVDHAVFGILSIALATLSSIIVVRRMRRPGGGAGAPPPT